MTSVKTRKSFDIEIHEQASQRRKEELWQQLHKK